MKESPVDDISNDICTNITANILFSISCENTILYFNQINDKFTYF